MKMYIAVLDSVPDHMVPVLVAHAVLGADREFNSYYEYQKWFSDYFFKVVIKVNDKEFNKIVNEIDYQVYLAHENKTLDGIKSCAVVIPMNKDKVPNVLKFAKLWSPNESNGKP